MAQEYKGTVVRVSLDRGYSAGDLRMLTDLVGKVEGVQSHFVDVENKILTAYLDEEMPESEEALVRALLAAGVYPTGFSEMGFTHEDDKHVC